MPVNRDKQGKWAEDTQNSVNRFNEWFKDFAPRTYLQFRERSTELVDRALAWTDNFRKVDLDTLKAHPGVLPVLRQIMLPPVARDRLAGLAGVTTSLVKGLEKRTAPVTEQVVRKIVAEEGDEEPDPDADMRAVLDTVHSMLDQQLLPWVDEGRAPTDLELARARTTIIERMAGADANPVIRNEPQKRQQRILREWLEEHGYEEAPKRTSILALKPGQFCFGGQVKGVLPEGGTKNVPIDASVMPHGAAAGDLPLLMELKAAGDEANTNKRGKEEPEKFENMKRAFTPEKYPKGVPYILFLEGYFGKAYLTTEAEAGLDWVWTHRPEDLRQFGL